MTKQILYIIICTLIYPAYFYAEMAIDIKATGHEKVPILIGMLSEDQELCDVSRVLKKDLEFYNQFAVVTAQMNPTLTKQAIADLHKQGYQLALFLNYTDDKQIEWRLYNTAKMAMIKGKKYVKRTNVSSEWAHHIADMVWPVLSSKPGSFSTKIAYCKQIPRPNGRHFKHIYVADYDGSNAHKLVGSATINVAPRWNKDLNNPMLFYSSCTNSNIRLMATDLQKHHKIVSNFDGLNMLPAFSDDGTKVVYCASRGDGNCQLYYYAEGVFKRLTRNNGNNISPVFSDTSDEIFFCSDFETGLPQIYCYHLPNNSIERITDGGYCASPAFCGINKMLAYTKIIKGVNQIFVYDVAKKEHKQITYDNCSKEECSWSNCGGFIICCITGVASSRIALFDLISHERHFITGEQEHCSYPSWSPSYHAFPQIAC